MELNLYENLSIEGKILLDDAMRFLEGGYDPRTGFVLVTWDGQPFQSNRATLYYALGEMILRGTSAEIEKPIRAILSRQIQAPGELFHGTFHNPHEAPPVSDILHADRLGSYGRYFLDIMHERYTAFLRGKIASSEELRPFLPQLTRMMNESLVEAYPVCWKTYEPNSREFILMGLVMILHYLRPVLSAELVRDIEKACMLGMEGSLARSASDFTPINTNILIMHIFLLDYLGSAFHLPAWQEKSVQLMNQLLTDYREFHAVAEFNSPTYCGVDLSTLGFFRRYSGNAYLRDAATELENGIWADMADFYNPAMENFSGPYSRAYEMDMSVHTCFHALLFLILGKDRFPRHPFSIETDNNPLLLLGDPRMDPALEARFLDPSRPARIRRTFRELSERGDPASCRAVCTCSAYITPDLMCGCMDGSENPSHQLHPLTVFWRCGSSLGTLKLLRCLSDGTMDHLHTVLFRGTCEDTTLKMQVENRCPEVVTLFFEIECPGADRTVIEPSRWILPGLEIAYTSQRHDLEKEILSENRIRLMLTMDPRVPDTLLYAFTLMLRLT